MPQTNGHSNGHSNGGTYDMEDGQSFLFTSESVGEGHPGEYQGQKTILIVRVAIHQKKIQEANNVLLILAYLEDNEEHYILWKKSIKKYPSFIHLSTK